MVGNFGGDSVQLYILLVTKGQFQSIRMRCGGGTTRMDQPRRKTTGPTNVLIVCPGVKKAPEAQTIASILMRRLNGHGARLANAITGYNPQGKAKPPPAPFQIAIGEDEKAVELFMTAATGDPFTDIVMFGKDSRLSRMVGTLRLNAAISTRADVHACQVPR